jgi:hypothetical protein
MKRLATLLILIFTALVSNVVAITWTIERQTIASVRGAKQTAGDESVWVGDYIFGENGGKTAGGTGIFITHSLGIHREAGALVAEIISQGYQTSRHLVGVVKVTGNTARIYFKSYGEDNLFRPYREGDLLLTLKRVSQRGRTLILTYWNAFEPAAQPLRNGRVYFKRERA